MDSIMRSEMSSSIQLTAKMEPFDSFWEGPENIEKGYAKFYQFYKKNYLPYIPKKKDAYILVVSCGPGYFVNLLEKQGYTNVLGIDSDPEKVRYAREKQLNCRVEAGFPFVENQPNQFDVIFCEQEINHLTKEEILHFLKLCRTIKFSYSLTALIHRSLKNQNGLKLFSRFCPLSFAQAKQNQTSSQLKLFFW